MGIEVGNYRLQRHPGGLCWQVHRHLPERVADRGPRAGETIPAGWVALEHYPTTVEGGLLSIAEMMAKDGEHYTALQDAAAEIEAIKTDLLNSVRGMRLALESALHELTTLNGLTAYDGTTAKGRTKTAHFEIKATAVIYEVQDALGGTR